MGTFSVLIRYALVSALVHPLICLSSSSRPMTVKRRLIIDTDGVADDIRAISLAMQNPDVEVLAITTTHGCASAKQAAANVARAQRANGIEKRIPIYKGAYGSLMNNTRDRNWNETAFFGADGIGGQPKAFPEVLESDFSCWEQEHAAQALIRLTKEHTDVTLVAIGPLSNLALAIQLDEEFKKRPAKLFIMGGNYQGVGNVDSYTSAEYNFHGDPEAASIVLAQMECPITIVPWELVLQGLEDMKAIDFEAHLNSGSPLANFLSAATSVGRKRLAKTGRKYTYCDEIAVAAAINEEKVIKVSKNLRVAVELEGRYTRGQVMVDWVANSCEHDESNERGADRTRRPIKFITAYDARYVDDLMCAATRKGEETVVY